MPAVNNLNIVYPNIRHFEFAQSTHCSCELCSKWRRWLVTLSKADKAIKGHAPSCKCNLCLLALTVRKNTLASELRLNLWIEIGWYADMENWKPGWHKAVWEEIKQSDKWWIVKGQYKPIDYWLDKFKEFAPEEMLLHDYRHETAETRLE